MRLMSCVAAVGAILALVPGVTVAQPPFGGFGANPVMLLGQESVQKELKLSDDQLKKVQELGEKTREKFGEIFGLDEAERGKKFQELNQENEKAVAAILKPEQGKRLKQIMYQRQGPAALGNPDVAKALGLTDEQQKKVKDINDETGKAMRELFTPGQPPDDETRKKMDDLRKSSGEKLLKVLTDEQKTKWKDLQGEPFKGEIRFGPPR